MENLTTFVVDFAFSVLFAFDAFVFEFPPLFAVIVTKRQKDNVMDTRKGFDDLPQVLTLRKE
jgi:hypothetical protein